jgi:hypothetical protein
MLFDGVKVFSATKARDRDDLSGRITDWISNNRSKIEIVDRIVTQSSDNEYHCYTMTIFYKFK